MICLQCLTRNYYFLSRNLRIVIENAHSLIVLLLKSISELSMLLTIENIEALSTSNLAIVVKSSDKSLIYVRKNNCPKFKPWGTPATTSAHEECWRFNTTPSLLSFKKSPKYLGACLLCHFTCHTLSTCHTLCEKLWIYQEILFLLQSHLRMI